MRFYQNGWRYGTLESIENKNARVLYAGRLKTVPLGDVEKLRAAGEEPPAAPARHARSRTLR